MEGEKGGRTVSHFISVSLSLSLTGPLCFLLMNSLVSVLKRTARVLSCLRAAIRGLMVLLTNIWAGVTGAYFTLGFPQPVFISFYILFFFVQLKKKKHLNCTFIK